MAKYKTKANKAEEQIHKLLEDNKNIFRPWSLIGKKLINRTLDCTSSEVNIIFTNNANVRPGFEVSDESVFLPNLFVKFSGIDENTRYFQRLSDLKSQENTFVYENFQGFCDTNPIDLDVSEFLSKEGTIDHDLLMQSDFFQFSFLKREYQQLLLNKIENVMNNKKDFFISRASHVSEDEILFFLLNIDSNLVTAFNEFDFQLKPPAIIFENNKRARVSNRQAVSIMLLNLLGFDIILISGYGYADIENQFNDDIYTLFYGEEISKRKKLKPRSKVLIAAASFVLSAGIVVASILPGLLDKPEDPIIKPPDQQTEISDPADDSSEDAEAPDDAVVDDSEKTDSVEGIQITYTGEKGKNYTNSIIDIYINDPDGNPIDMSQVSYTINRGGTTISKDLYSGYDPSWRDGPVFNVSDNEDKLQINAIDDGQDFYYIIAADTEDYAFLFEGKLLKEEYINNRRIDLTFNMQGVEKTHLSVNTGNDLKSSVDFYIYNGENSYNPIDEDFNQGCHGNLRINSGKDFYSNVTSIDYFMYFTVSDGLVFYSARTQPMVAPEISSRIDRRAYFDKKLTINPELTDFPYYLARITYPGSNIRIKETIPSSNIIKIYSNSSPPATVISLSKDPDDIYVSGLSGINLNDDNVFGFENKITEFFAMPESDNIIRLETRFTDSFFNTFAYLGYSHDGEKPGIYDYSMLISKDGKTLVSKTMSPYDSYIEINLADGTYEVEVKPAYENTLYTETSYFTLIVNNDLNERVSFVYNENK